MKNFIIVSHRRSGTHFLWRTLKLNFNLKKDASIEGDMGGFKWHRIVGDTPEKFIENHTCVHLIRDPRDTLTSLWYYWQRGAEKSLKMEKFLENKTFSQYIKGISVDRFTELGFNIPGPQLIDVYTDPIKHWADYAEWDKHLYTIRFEDLKENPKKVMKEFAKEFNLPLRDDYKILRGLVGHFPRKGVVGDWKNLFTEEDNIYLKSKLGVIMEKFGYF